MGGIVDVDLTKTPPIQGSREYVTDPKMYNNVILNGAKLFFFLKQAYCRQETNCCCLYFMSIIVDGYFRETFLCLTGASI